MVFSSILFLLFFLPFVVILYYLLPDRFKNAFLLFSSLAFYAWGGPKFILILVGSTLLDYYLVDALSKSIHENKRRLLLVLSLTITVGLLAYFKYANFFIDNINELLKLLGAGSIPWVKVLLPIGISFFSFQKLTYAVDVYRGVHEPFKKPQDYLLYIVMFPQLIAGPIIRFNEIVDQIESRVHKTEEIFQGSVRFIIGLAKKVLIANALSGYADSIFNGDLQQIDTIQAWLAILAYTFQIYFDFSGYSDMAIGLGRIFGMRFPENFNNPYISKNITEFWRRWHITLGRWMKDYLYIPLGGNRVKSQNRLYFNLIVVFFISGLWHGAAWNFIIWGLFHGVFLILDRLFLVKLLNKLGKTFSIVFTFFITILGWVVFRIEDMQSIKIFYSKLFAFEFTEFVFGNKLDVLITLIVAMVFSFFTLSKVGLKMEQIVFETSYTQKVKIILFVICMVLLFLTIGSITASKFNPFIYFRF